MSQHERYTINTSFVVCEGLKDSVLAEIQDIIVFVNKTLGHAYDIKIKVNHEPEIEIRKTVDKE